MINCRGTYTIITGSRSLRQVTDAMVEATNHYVNMDDLMEAVGRRLAEVTGAERAISPQVARRAWPNWRPRPSLEVIRKR